MHLLRLCAGCLASSFCFKEVKKFIVSWCELWIGRKWEGTNEKIAIRKLLERLFSDFPLIPRSIKVFISVYVTFLVKQLILFSRWLFCINRINCLPVYMQQQIIIIWLQVEVTFHLLDFRRRISYFNQLIKLWRQWQLNLQSIRWSPESFFIS